MKRFQICIVMLLSLAACSGDEPTSGSATKLNAVEIEPGTISDSMIVLDDAASDGTAPEESPAAGDSAAAVTADAAPENATEEASEDSENGEEIVAPGGVRKATTATN